MLESKRYLATLWLMGAGILFTIVLFQTFLGYYGADFEDAWRWLLPTIVPTLSLIMGVMVSDALQKRPELETVDRFLFNLAFCLSAAYLLTVLITLLVQPFSELPPPDLMSRSHLWLGPFQGLVSACLGAFFVRSVPEAAGGRAGS